MSIFRSNLGLLWRRAWWGGCLRCLVGRFFARAHRTDLDCLGFETAVGRFPIRSAHLNILGDVGHLGGLTGFGYRRLVRDFKDARAFLARNRKRVRLVVDGRNHSVERNRTRA